MKSTTPCAVIFDMDGVLVNSEPVYMDIERNLFQSVGADISSTEHDGFVGTPVAGLWKLVVSRATLPCSVAELHEASRARIREWLAEPGPLTPMPGVIELLNLLDAGDIPFAVASSSSPHNIEAILRRLGIRERFAAVVSGHEVPRGKPAPDVFLEAARRLGANPAGCTVFEDAHFGVAGAKAAGMFCVGVRNPGSGNQDLSAADLVVDSLTEVLESRLLSRTPAGSPGCGEPAGRV
ncbi:MAG: HAD family phosphatase [Spirochaetaceae bacterium]|nr:MAG: HAD family phosphatase [Spirochaetaceae bacterium]